MSERGPRPSFGISRLAPADVARLRDLNCVFATAFEDRETYQAKPPDDAYLANVLAKEHVVVLAAQAGSDLVGGLVAYELDKLEMARREVYIYDLAVDARHRRLGIATALIDRLREIARQRGAWVIYVQADYADPAAIALYTKLGLREDVLHFDIDVDR